MSESEPTEWMNFDAMDALERRRVREMDEKFCECLASAIERGRSDCQASARNDEGAGHEKNKLIY